MSVDERLETREGRRARIPALPWPDDTARLLRDGYLWGARGFARVGGDAFRTRLLGRPVLALRGAEAARFFYEGGRFRRGPDAIPRSVGHLLQDDGSVQTLEHRPHRTRKALFTELLLDEAEQRRIVDAVVAAWREALASMPGEEPASLLDIAAEALTRGITAALGADEADPEHGIAASDLMSMVENAGRFGPPNWAARARRRATEQRVQELVAAARALPPGASPLSRIAHHSESGGVLPLDTAAVELLNLLRPVAAVAHFVVFAGWALHMRPELAPGVAGSPDVRRAFAQEVRRFFPFFPVVGGRAMRDLIWEGEWIAEGDWVMLDLYGTDHHPDQWEHPDRFDPGRFLGEGAERLVVAQGAGDFARTHHCPGEPLAVLLVDALARELAERPPLVAPDQDLRIHLRRFPAMPRDGMLIAPASR